MFLKGIIKFTFVMDRIQIGLYSCITVLRLRGISTNTFGLLWALKNICLSFRMFWIRLWRKSCRCLENLNFTTIALTLIWSFSLDSIIGLFMGKKLLKRYLLLLIFQNKLQFCNRFVVFYRKKRLCMKETMIWVTNHWTIISTLPPCITYKN